MSNMFNEATSFNQNISKWIVSNVTDMSSMFRKAIKFNQDIGKWTVSSVTDMTSMFYRAIAFNQIIGEWTVSSVSNMSFMFSGAKTFNQDIGEWLVSSVTDMNNMFSLSTVFNQNIKKWSVSRVTDMSYMFYMSFNFNQNIGSWNIGKIQNGEYMLDDTAISINNWDATIKGWYEQNFKNSNVKIGANRLFYCNSATQREEMKNKNIFNFIGDNKSLDCKVLNVENLVHNDIKMYPNPTSGKVHINTEIENIIIYNISGQQIANIKTNDFDISSFNTGVYFVIIETDKGFQTKKLLKK